MYWSLIVINELLREGVCIIIVLKNVSIQIPFSGYSSVLTFKCIFRASDDCIIRLVSNVLCNQMYFFFIQI